MLLSFERPAASRPFCATPCCGPARIGISKDSASCRTLRRLEVRALCRTLKTAQLAVSLTSISVGLTLGITESFWHRPATSVSPGSDGRPPSGRSSKPETQDHRQDSKGTRWMPRHQESMKGVDDCDKPR